MICQTDDFVSDQLAVGSIRFPRQSVNRGSLSEPEDALFSEEGAYDGFGVVELKVGDIPARIEQENGPPYLFSMQHVPLDHNYAHSEIWSDQEPATETYRVPSKTVKLSFRIELCRKIRRDRIRIEATVSRSTR